MAGRGRGRGRGLSFDIEKLGVSRSDLAVPTSCDPPPLYPPLKFKPVPLDTSEKYAYMVAIKQELRAAFRESPFYVAPVAVKKDVERYSDKYQQVPPSDTVKWDWSIFPKELRPRDKLKRKITKSSPIAKKMKIPEVDLKEKFNEQEATAEGSESDEEKDEKDEDEEGVEDEELFEEEELEEGTDYVSSYFDNGESYLDEDDDNLDEPTY